MLEFINSLSTLSWWLSVVFVGIALNILSAYLKFSIDKLLSKVSTTWSARTASQKHFRLIKVEELRIDKHKQLLLLADESRCRHLCNTFLIISLILLVVYIFLSWLNIYSLAIGVKMTKSWLQDASFWGALVSMFLSVLEFLTAIKCKTIVNDAQKED
jgi:hypothetical protein